MAKYQRHGMSRTRLYKIWAGMLVRCGHRACSNPDAFKYYITKGITVCRTWRDFPTFARWATAHGYADNLTIERRDSMDDYRPGNCKWVTMRDNLRARSDRKLTLQKARVIRHLRKQGLSGYEVASRFGVSRDYVYRISAGARWAE